MGMLSMSCYHCKEQWQAELEIWVCDIKQKKLLLLYVTDYFRYYSPEIKPLIHLYFIIIYLTFISIIKKEFFLRISKVIWLVYHTDFNYTEILENESDWVQYLYQLHFKCFPFIFWQLPTETIDCIDSATRYTLF